MMWSHDLKGTTFSPHQISILSKVGNDLVRGAPEPSLQRGRLASEACSSLPCWGLQSTTDCVRSVHADKRTVPATLHSFHGYGETHCML